jgi:hypothetical protein
MIAERKAEAEAEKTDGGNEPLAPVVPLCYPYGPSKEFNFNKNVVVGDGCGSLNSCTGVPYPEFVQVEIIPPTIYTGSLLCSKNEGSLVESGDFACLQWRDYTTQNISANPCWDSGNKNVRFNINISDKATGQNSPILKAPAHLIVCEQNIQDAGLILIQRTDQLLSIMRNFPEQIAVIKRDIYNALSRYNGTIEKYKFFDELMAHESEHKKDYQENLLKLKKQYLDKIIENYTITCAKYKFNPEDALLRAISEYKVTYIADYIDAVIIEQKKISENDVQNRPSVQASLYEYQLLIYKFENHLIF